MDADRACVTPPPHASLLALAVVALIQGCVAGPDYVAPRAPEVEHYVARPDGASSPRLARGARPRADWWTGFGSPTIDRLVADALARSPTLDAAHARLAAANAQLAAQRGLRYPTVDASASLSRRAGAGGTTASGTTASDTTPSDAAPDVGTAGGASRTAGSASAYTVFTAGASVRYDVDPFGRVDRLVEAAAALAIAERARVSAAWLSVAGNVVATALDVAIAQALIVAREELLEGQRERLSLLDTQYREGALARADVLAARTEVSVLRAELPPLRLRLQRGRHRLAELTGRAPSTIGAIDIRLDALKVPDVVPLVLPSTLVRERPDIVAAESALAAANARIGIATADLYPRLSLDGPLGRVAVDTGGATLWGSTWALGANLLAPLLQGGRLAALRDAALADYRARLADYRSTVLAALREVADGIRALEHNADAVAARQVALANARESLSLANFRLRQGVASVIDVLTVERRYQESLIASIDTLGQRLQDAAALYAALGRSPLSEDAIGAARLDRLLRTTADALERGVAPASVVAR
ncbi:MAG: efflux transporter outer membrane subunit [Lautropia sp.]